MNVIRIGNTAVDVNRAEGIAFVTPNEKEEFGTATIYLRRRAEPIRVPCTRNEYQGLLEAWDPDFTDVDDLIENE